MSIRKHSLPVILYLVGIVFAYHPMLFSGLRRVQIDHVDSRLVNYLLEHGFQWIQRNPPHRDLWSPPFFYPAPDALAYSDTLLSAGPLYWPWRLAGLPPDTSFQFWLMSCGTVNYFLFLHLLCSMLHLRPGPSAMGAFLFAFGAPRVAGTGHPQLFPQFFSIIAILALGRIFAARAVPRWRKAVQWSVALLAIAAQIYSSFYMGWFLMCALGVAFCAALSSRVMRPVMLAVLRRDALPIGFASVLVVAVISPLLTRYLQVAGLSGYRSIAELRMGIPMLRSWIYLGPESWLYGWMPRLPWFLIFGSLEPEHRLGLGMVTPLVCLAGLMRGWESPIIRIFGWTGLTLFLVATPVPRGCILGLALSEWLLCVAVLIQSRGKPKHQLVACMLFALLSWVLFPRISLFVTGVCWAPVIVAGQTVLRRQRILLYALTAAACAIFLVASTFLDMPLAPITAFLVVLIWCLLSRVRARTIPPLGLAAAVVATAVFLVLVPGNLILWRLALRVVPGAAAIRFAARVVLLVLVPLSAGFAVFWERFGSRGSWRFAIPLGLVCLLEQGISTTTFDKQGTRDRIQTVATWVENADKPIAFFHSPHGKGPRNWDQQVDAMWAEIATRVPTVNGYSGSVPPGWGPLSSSEEKGVWDEQRERQSLLDWALVSGLPPRRIAWIRDGRQLSVVLSRGLAPHDSRK